MMAEMNESGVVASCMRGSRRGYRGAVQARGSVVFGVTGMYL
jgi:hypothetical protein